MARQGMGALRVTAIVGFIVSMPVLALPAVNDRLDRWIFGDEEVTSAEPPPDRPRLTLVETSPPSAAAEENAFTSLESQTGPLTGSLTGPLTGVGEAVESLGASTPLERLPSVTADALAENDAEIDADAASVVQSRPSDRIRRLQARLEQLGATYLRLEELNTGRQERVFRFQCQMPIAGGSAYQRPFQVEHADPLEAMQRVLAEVETWCAARDAGRTWR